MWDLKVHQALPVHVDVLVPRALPDRVAREERRGKEAPEEYQDPLGLPGFRLILHRLKQTAMKGNS